MKQYRGSLLYLIAFFVVLQTVVVLIGNLNRPPWGDEYRLLQTVHDFADRLDLDRLTHYEQLSTPLPFVVYALWGKLVGFDLWRLRLLSLLIALLSYTLFHRLLWEHFRSGVVAFLTTALLVVHPYMVGFSIFVFTDGLTIFFLIAGLLAYVRRLPWLIAVAIAGSLLCRQYVVFFAVAAIMCLGHEFFRGRKRDSARLFAASLLGLLPFGALVLLWGGLSPVNQWREFYATEQLSFHPSFLVLYVALMTLYALPIVVFAGKRIYWNRAALIAAFALCGVYWFLPVKPSPYAVDIDVHTVGLFHKAVVGVTGADWPAQFVFFVGFALGLPILYHIVRSVLRDAFRSTVASTLIYDLAILLFLAIMPFSYLNWEKYFVPLLPFLFVRLLMFHPRLQADPAA